MRELKPGSDCYDIYMVLKDRKPHHIQEIFDRVKPSARNFAARSRISDLTKQYGFNIINIRDIQHKENYKKDINRCADMYGENDREGIYLLLDNPKPIESTKECEKTISKGHIAVVFREQCMLITEKEDNICDLMRKYDR